MREKIILKLRMNLKKYFSTTYAIEKLMLMCKIDAFLELVSVSELPPDLAKKVLFYNLSLMRVSL